MFGESIYYKLLTKVPKYKQIITPLSRSRECSGMVVELHQVAAQEKLIRVQYYC